MRFIGQLLTNEINLILKQNQLPLLPAPIQMTKAIKIIKTAVIATDYLVDIASSFFLEIK